MKSAKLTLEEFMKRRQSRAMQERQKRINKQMNIAHLKLALIKYLEELPLFHHREITDIEIPALTTELVDIRIHTKAT